MALTNTSSITVESCYLLFGTQKSFTCLCVADVTGSLNTKILTIPAYDFDYVAKSIVVTISTGSSTPTYSATTKAIAVQVASGATAAAVAAAVKAGLDLATDMIASVTISTATLTVTLKQFGLPAEATTDAGFTLVVVTAGEGGTLGATQDGVEITFDKTTADVAPDQFGTQLQDQIMTGVNVTVSSTLLELTAANMSVLLGNSWGAETTPQAGTEVIGVGSSKNFLNLKQYAKQLILRPVKAANYATSHFFWKALPNLSSLSLTGSDLKNAPVEFTVMIDETKNTAVNLYCYGDGFQSLGV